MRLIRILVILTSSHWGIYPLVNDALVVDHALEPSIDNRSTWCHRPVWNCRDLGGRFLDVLDDRLPEVEWQESGEVISNLTVKCVCVWRGTHCSSIRFISGDIVSNSFVLRLARSGLSSKRISSSS